MLNYVPENSFAPFSGIMKSVTAVILGLYLSVGSFEDFGDIEIKNMFLFCSIQQKTIVFVYPCILDAVFVDSVIIYGTDRHKYYIGIGRHLCHTVYKIKKSILIMLLTGIIDTVYSQKDIDDRRLMRLKIRF